MLMTLYSGFLISPLQAVCKWFRNIPVSYILLPPNELSMPNGLREAMAHEKPLQIVGTINANHALLATQAGFKAIYLSGGGVAAGSLGVPDLGITNLNDVLIDIDRITNVTDTPLLVDVDTGFGPSAFNVARTVRALIKAGSGGFAHRGPGGRQALRASPRKGGCVAGRDGGPDQGCRRRADGPGLRHWRAHGCHCRGGYGLGPGCARRPMRQAGADFIFAELVPELADSTSGLRLWGCRSWPISLAFGMTPLYTVEEL